jgi:hypothetical protein
MKSMKLWMGLTAAVMMTTGCGSDSPSESACGRIADSTDDTANRLEACFGGGAEAESTFDQSACTTALEKCSDGEAEKVASYFDCSFDALTCDSLFGDEADMDAYLDKVLACAQQYNPSATCVGYLDDVDFGANGAARKAMLLKAVR